MDLTANRCWRNELNLAIRLSFFKGKRRVDLAIRKSFLRGRVERTIVLLSQHPSPPPLKKKILIQDKRDHASERLVKGTNKN